MKVLFVAPAVPWPLTSGSALRTFHVLREASKSCDLHVRAVGRADLDERAARAALAACASLEILPRSASTVAARVTQARVERWVRSSALAEQLARDARERFDVVHLDEISVLRALPAEMRAPLVVHHHKLDADLARELATRARDRYDAWKCLRLEARAAARSRFHVVCSEPDRRRLLARHPHLDCAVVPNGVDVDRLGAPPAFVERDADHVLFLGALDAPPNVDALAWYVRSIHPRLRDRRENMVLEVVGSRASPALHALSTPTVRIHGAVADVRPALARASVLVVPLRIGGGTRIRILEALALGCPVVSTRAGVEGLDLEDGLHLVLADDAESFAAAVAALLEDPERARRLADAGRERVLERYRWETIVPRLVAAWRSAIAP